MSIDQIDQNLRQSQEPMQRIQHNTPQNHETSKQVPNLKIYNLDNKEIMNKKISLKTVQELLSQKEFVKKMFEKNPNFVKIVTKEVKERIQDELRGKI